MTRNRLVAGSQLSTFMGAICLRVQPSLMSGCGMRRNSRHPKVWCGRNLHAPCAPGDRWVATGGRSHSFFALITLAPKGRPSHSRGHRARCFSSLPVRCAGSLARNFCPSRVCRFLCNTARHFATQSLSVIPTAWLNALLALHSISQVARAFL